MFRGTVAMLLCAVISIESTPTPNAPCKREDNACQTKKTNSIYKEIIVGIPSMNIDNLNPLYQEYIEGKLATVTYKINKAYFEGFKDCDIVNTKLSIKKQSFRLVIHCPIHTMYGHYNINGTLVGVPIQGDGEFKVIFKDYNLNIDAYITLTENNGKQYMSFKNFTVEGDIRGGMNVNITNLFNGDTELADNMLKIINANWMLIANFHQGPVFTANVKKIIKNFNKYFKTVPLDTIIMP